MLEIYDYIEERVNEENEYVNEEYGEDMIFCIDTIYEDFQEQLPEHLIIKYNLDECCPLETSNKDAIVVLKDCFDEWVKETNPFSWDGIERKIRIYRNDMEDMRRTQAAEMGCHDYYGGNYHQSDYVDNMWSSRY
tara:strand:+ start:579 stop:983 length:405 start_codon:yes stop_codon:yes gene_type:complete